MRFPFKGKTTMLHPFLFAIFPVLFLYSYNIQETSLGVILKPLALILVGTALILFVSNLIFRNWEKSSLFTTLLVLIFFSHGHTHTLIGALKYQIGGFEIGTDDILFGIWATAIVGTFFILLLGKKNLAKFTGLLNLVSSVLVFYSLVTAVPYEISRTLTTLSRSQEDVNQQAELGIGYKPDIYYLIFDRYTGNKVLKDFYGYDNSGFTDYLEEKGFYVAKNSFANYPRTLLSLGSSLNFKYLDSGEKVTEQVKDHELGRFLKSQGYRYLHIGSWAGATNTSPIADINFEVGEVYLDLDEFTLKLFETTVLAPAVRKVFPGTSLFDFGVQHKNRSLYQLARIKEIPGTQPGPKFVFAHILLPHDPYVFNSDCGDLELSEQMLDNYLSQLACTNKLIQEVVENILQDSPQLPIIVIQGDEGSLDWTTLEPMKYPFKEGQSYKNADPRSMLERASILNAYYLPNGDYAGFNPLISPVNSFRLILNRIFGTDYEILSDRSYIFQEDGNLYDIKRTPLKFIDVTDKVVQ